MSTEERPVHPSSEEVAEKGIRVLREPETDARGVAIHPVSRKPVSTGETKDPLNSEDNVA